MNQSDGFIVFDSVSKFFPNVVANQSVDLEIQKGEIHALLGENGAGKTTLMNILYGLYVADEGRIFLDGQETRITNPNDAIRLGIGMIHQHFMLIGVLSVWENIILGQKMPKGYRLDVATIKADIEKIVHEFNMQLDLDDKVESLSVGVQQKIEILKALYRGTKILILDEPTSVLTPSESEDLFRLLLNLKKNGCTIIFISHKLKEVMEISNRISVLRDGRMVGTYAAGDCDASFLSNQMVGRDVTLRLEKAASQPGEALLKIQGLSYSGKSKKESLRNITLTVRGGEIFGIAGVDGNGQDQLAEVLAGLLKPEEGHILFAGEDVSVWTVKQRGDYGFSYVPADRLNVGLAVDLKLYENSVLSQFAKAPYAKSGRLQTKVILEHADTLIQNYAIKAPSANVAARNLSGGNQQKLILAREIEKKPKILLIVQPTWGLDIGACSFVYQKILEQRSLGVAILLISTDLEEVRTLSDRVAVIYEGEVSAPFDPLQTPVSEIGMLMTGAKTSAANT